MKKNMGAADRMIRIVLAVLLIVLYTNKVVEGALGIVLLILAGVFLLTSFISVCPLYIPFGINTCKKK